MYRLPTGKMDPWHNDANRALLIFGLSRGDVQAGLALENPWGELEMQNKPTVIDEIRTVMT